MVETVAPGRRERKKQATRQALRQAALRLGSERGIANITVEEISDAADVAPRTFFNYFSCKEDALVDESPETVAELRQMVAARPPGERPMETLRAVLKEVAETHTTAEHQEEARLRQRLIQENPALLSRKLARFVALEQVLAEALAERIGTASDTDARPVVLASVGMSMLRVAFRRWNEDQTRPVSELIDEAFDVLARGM